MTSRTLNIEGMTDASDKNSFMFFINDSSFSSTKACKISASTKKKYSDVTDVVLGRDCMIEFLSDLKYQYQDQHVRFGSNLLNAQDTCILTKYH